MIVEGRSPTMRHVSRTHRARVSRFRDRPSSFLLFGVLAVGCGTVLLSGVLTATCGTELDHGVLAVGCGTVLLSGVLTATCGTELVYEFVEHVAALFDARFH